MRSLVLAALLGLATLTAFPDKAEAQWRRNNVWGRSYYNPYGNYGSYSRSPATIYGYNYPYSSYYSTPRWTGRYHVSPWGSSYYYGTYNPYSNQYYYNYWNW